MSYNVWNYNDGANWNVRKTILAVKTSRLVARLCDGCPLAPHWISDALQKLMRATDADIIGVQEARKNLRNPNATSQVEDLADLLTNDYPHFA